MKTTNSFRSKFFALVLALVASVSSFAKDGYPDFQVDGLYYSFLEGDSVQVTFLRTNPIPTEVAADTSNKKYAPAATTGAEYGHLTEIVIPSTVTYEEKTYHVIRIGHGSFLKCVNLQHVDLPTSIKSIGVAAFWSCHSLSSITLNEGLESIEEHALWDCPTLKEVTLPSTLKSLGQKVFGESTSLSKVICKAAVPPVVENDLLTGTDNYNASIIPNATLYVPASSLTTYKNTYPWNTFGQILPIEDSFQDIFPTLLGLERTEVEGTTMGFDEPYQMSFSQYTPTLVDGTWYLYDGRNYFREANNQILWYAPEFNITDAVLYDWTLEVGDTLPIYTSTFNSDAKRGAMFRVTDVSTIKLLDGKEYKKWTFSGGYEYVEGIGAINKGFGLYYCLLHNAHPAIYTSTKTICISKNGQLLYQMDEIKMISNELKCMCELTPSYKDQWCNTWNTIDFDGMRFEETAETWQYKLANDTIINNQKYTIVNRYWTADRNNTKQYVAAVRFTDDRKVYIYYDNAEYLLYDFNVQEGDELEVFAGINNYTSEIKTYKCTVTGVEQYACVGCPAAITLEVHNHPNDFREFYRQTQWIEGVGDINGFLNGINHYVEVDGGYTYCLLCAYHDEEQVYTTDNEKLASYNCEYNAGYEYSSPTLAGLQRTMCREYIGYEGRNETWMTETEKEVLINDKFYRKWDKWLLREENDRIYVYSNKQDILLYDFTLEVGDSLRTLILHPDLGIIDVPIGTIYPIDTLIVTNISTVTLLDGKEYRKWSFNNGEFEYVKGIGCLDGNFLALAKDVVNGDYINSHLVCVSKNGQLLYKMDESEMAQLETECLCDVETSYKSQWCNKWNVMWFDGMRFDETARTSKYRLGKDTVIGDYTYSKFISGTYVRFTDDRKVYVYHEYFDDHDPYSEDLPTGEYLAYDFSAKVGDTLEVFSGIRTYSTYPCIVDEVQTDPETALRTITLHKICRMDTDGDGIEEDYDDREMRWIEGVGSPEGFLISDLPCGWVGGGTNHLLCAYKDDELIYTDSFYERFGCDYNAGVVSDDLFPTLSGLQRTICREYCEQADNKTRIEQFTNLTTRTETGAPYIYCSPFLLREKDNKILIYSRTLNKDLVLYDFNLQVGDSLPMLYIDFFAKDDWIADRDMEIWCVVDYHKDLEGNILPADTLIVTDVSMITLLDGKEYKKWTFNNGMEYVEGIGSFGNGQWSGDFFQLIANKDVPTCLLDEHLVCVSKNNQLLYQMNAAEMERLGAECLCEYNNGPKKDNAKEGKIGGRPTPTQWNMLEVETKEMDGTPTILRAETFSYTLENDSIVTKGKTFYQLARQSTKDTAITKSFVGALHFGEDEDNRVYFLRDGVEYVLYDFTAEPGDTIEIFAGINNYPQETTYTHVVTGKDTLENGACRMMLEVVFPEETASIENAQKVWLAGLGSIDGIVHNAATRATKARSSETQTSVMLCAWREDSCLYTTNHPEYDTFGCVYNQDPTAVEDVETSGYKYQKIIRDGHLYILRDNKLYDVLGTPMN